MKWDLPIVDNQVIGVEVLINSDGSCIYNQVILKKTYSKVDITISKSNISVEEILKSNYPTLISISGKGILHKQINRALSDTDEELFIKALPNAKPEDFYFQLYAFSESSCIVSFTRKNSVEAVIDSLKGVKIISVTLGPFCLQSSLPVISPGDSDFELRINYHKLLISHGDIVVYETLDISETDKLLKQGNFEIQSTVLVAFSAAFAYFHPVTHLSSNISTANEAYKEYKYEVKVKKYGVIILAVSLVLLLFNFAAYTYLFDMVKIKSAQFALTNSEIQKLDSFKTQLEEKSRFLSENGLLEPSRTSFYADEIAKDVPSEISLTSLNIQPLKQNEDESKIEFDSKKVLVSGRSSHSLTVNEWLHKLREKEWARTIVLLDYNQREGAETGDFTFVINLK